MKWLRPVDRTSGMLTLSAGTLSCLAHYGTPLSKRCPTTTALEHTTVPMDDADRMPPLDVVKTPALWIASKSFCRYGRRKFALLCITANSPANVSVGSDSDSRSALPRLAVIRGQTDKVA